MKKGILAVLLLFVIPIAFGVQVNSSTEIYSFNITDCQADTASVGCPAATIRFNCSISNFNSIDYADFRISGSDYTTSRLNSSFWLDYYKGVTLVDTNTSITFDRVTIHDLSSGIALYFPAISVSHFCDACAYNITADACNISNEHIVHYVGDGSANCTSYNASESCDYCVPSWSITSSCLENNTEYRQYSDANSCYTLTSLYSDSCNYAHADCDSWISCSYLQTDFTCGYDSNPLIEIAGNRIFWYCSFANTSQDYNCISYVKESGFTIQTNPQQKTFSAGIFSKEQESREFFAASNGLVNPYFTTDNLKSNSTYIFGVECTSGQGKYTTEHYVTPLYQSLDVVAYRSVWVKDNLGYALGGLIVVILIIAILMMVMRR